MAVRTKPTLKQARFARAYIETGNGAEAAIRAGYDVKDRTNASAVATDNLQKPIVQREIETWQAYLERQVMPSLKTIKDIRDQKDDKRLSLAAARDLLNRAGVSKAEPKQSLAVVFANMDEAKLLEKMAQLAEPKKAIDSGNVIDIPPSATP